MSTIRNAQGVKADVAAEVAAALDARQLATFSVSPGSTLAEMAAWWAARAAVADERATQIARLREDGWTGTQHPVVAHLVSIAEVGCEEQARRARDEARRCRREARDGSAVAGS